MRLLKRGGVYLNKPTNEVVDATIKSYQAGTTTFEDVYTVLHAERVRFIREYSSRAFNVDESDLSASFDDVVTKAVDEFNGTGTFVGYLRMKLESSVLNLMKSKCRRGRHEKAYREMNAVTRATPYLMEHEVEYAEYKKTLPDVLRQAVAMLEDGVTMNETSKALGYRDMRTLRDHLRKAFVPFFTNLQS